MSEDKKESIKIEGISINKIKSDYKPFLAVAFCWTDNGEKGLFYDYVQPSFAVHPCDLFNKNGNREEWKYLNEEEKSIETVLEDKNEGEKEKLIKEHFKDMLPEKAEYLRKNIAGGIQVSNFGRVGIPVNLRDKANKANNELCKGCTGCALNDKCKKFHFILPQYENRFWNDSEEEFKTYNGYLVVDNVITKENDNLVYHLVTEAFKMKESTLKYLEEENPNLITYINEIIDETVNKEALKKEAIEELNKAIETLRKGEKISLQIHHIDNNGHHNTPTYWDENGKMIEGNLIALPEKVHQKIHGKS